MTSLLIHNSKVPDITVKKFSSAVKLVPNREQLASDTFDYDFFYDLELDKILKDKQYAIIYISLNLSDHDYLELNGLRVANQIRLSPKWKHTHVSLVLLGQESYFELMKLNSLSNILVTPGVYLKSDLIFEIDSKKEISPSDYLQYLTRINVEPPANYSSHHSITNEWNIKRWFEMIENDNSDDYQNISVCVSKLVVINSIYFKYIEELSKVQIKKNHRQRIKKKDQIELKISGIETKKILFIDDEGFKGWDVLMKYIFRHSGAEVEPFVHFDKQDTQEITFFKISEALIKDNFILNYDLLILDLRLCDEDFYINDINKLVSVRLIQEIRKLNAGFQILVFTASNKSWNIQKVLDLKVRHYVVKEAPEQLFDKQESYLKFVEFSRAVRSSIDNSFLAKLKIRIENLKAENNFLVSISEDEIEFKKSVFAKGGLLDELYTLLDINYEKLINNALLICFSILENYAEMYIVSEATWKIIDKNDTLILNYISSSPKTPFELKKGYFLDVMQNFTEKKDETLIGVNFYDSPQQRSMVQNVKAKKLSPILKIALVLKYRDNLSNDTINALFKLRFIRNNSTAHAGNIKPGIKITLSDIDFFIDNVFKIIFRK
jgi:CheY-like chemotaxis protein